MFGINRGCVIKIQFFHFETSLLCCVVYLLCKEIYVLGLFCKVYGTWILVLC